MAVSMYFGLPGSGKTTMLAYLAKKNMYRYRYIYSNVRINMPGVTYIDNECIGKYDLSYSLVLVDEAALFANNRDYKNFSAQLLEFINKHRHYHVDIVFFTQRYNGVDINIRSLTVNLYYIYKTRFWGRWITKCYPIAYGIQIPDSKSAGDKLGEIVEGYSKPHLLVRLFARRIWRPKYYAYFDSWEAEPLPPLPGKYPVSPKPPRKREPNIILQYFSKTFILLRWRWTQSNTKPGFPIGCPGSFWLVRRHMCCGVLTYARGHIRRQQGNTGV